MNLAVITSGFLPIPATKGGAVENLVVNLLNENEKNPKMKFTIFSIFESKAFIESKKYKNTSFIFIKPNIITRIFDKIVFFIAKNILKKENSQSYRFIFQRLYFLNCISKNLKNNNYDKILLENHPTQFLALKWRKNYIKYKDRYYYHCHNEFVGTYGCKTIIKNTKKILCVSNFIMKSVMKNLKIDGNRCAVLRNGIDTKIFSKLINDTDKQSIKKKYNIDEEDKILLYTGRIVPEKGIKELLQSLQLIQHKNFKLLILGAALNNIKIKTKYEKEIEEIVKDNNDKVIFTGFINYEEIYKFYDIANIAVLPSIWNDPAPLTVIESLICGLPIITTYSGGIPEYATNGSAIFLNRDRNLIENLAHCIDYLLSDYTKLEEMRKNCKEVSKNLTSKNYFDTFCKYMEE